jgi:nucleoid DNA-binding protein
VRKENIVSRLAEVTLDKKQAKETFEKIFDIIKYGLEKDGKVIISNFGTFIKVKSKPSVRHNPKTLEKVEVPAKIKVRFKPSPAILKNLK